MIIADRLREFREAKDLSQGDIEKRTGLLRCYVSRVENGHTIPAIETLEKFARALEVPVYQLLYDGEAPPKVPPRGLQGQSDSSLFGNNRREHAYLAKLCRALGRSDARSRKLVLSLAEGLARKQK
jgi:transcriptional regulator with XRE-family HTH domain